jgi:hypothetical protein
VETDRASPLDGQECDGEHAKVQIILIEGAALYLEENVGSANPKVCWAK